MTGAKLLPKMHDIVQEALAERGAKIISDRQCVAPPHHSWIRLEYCGHKFQLQLELLDEIYAGLENQPRQTKRAAAGSAAR